MFMRIVIHSLWQFVKTASRYAVLRRGLFPCSVYKKTLRQSGPTPNSFRTVDSLSQISMHSFQIPPLPFPHCSLKTRRKGKCDFSSSDPQSPAAVNNTAANNKITQNIRNPFFMRASSRRYFSGSALLLHSLQSPLHTSAARKTGTMIVIWMSERLLLS